MARRATHIPHTGVDDDVFEEEHTMRVPESLMPLVEHGLIDQVIRALKSGKEAQVFLVKSRGEIRIAKVYKEAEHRSFKNRAAYTEGRQVRNSRDQRAMARRSTYGRDRDEASWRMAESEIITTLHNAEVTVPEPYVFFEGVLLMEYITDEHGDPAPRIAEVEMNEAEKERIFAQILREIVKMLHVDIVHGDLSTYNILLAQDVPVIIDFPQAVNAAANANAKELLVRDMQSLTTDFLSHKKEFKDLNYGDELWDIYSSGELAADTELTGAYTAPDMDVDTSNILAEIAFFEQEERKKREALGLNSYSKKKRKGAPPAAPSTQATGHEEMERVAEQWEREEAKGESSSTRGDNSRRRRGHRDGSQPPTKKKKDAPSRSRRRRGRPGRRDDS